MNAEKYLKKFETAFENCEKLKAKAAEDREKLIQEASNAKADMESAANDFVKYSEAYERMTRTNLRIEGLDKWADGIKPDYTIDDVKTAWNTFCADFENTRNTKIDAYKKAIAAAFEAFEAANAEIDELNKIREKFGDYIYRLSYLGSSASAANEHLKDVPASLPRNAYPFFRFYKDNNK